LAYGTLSIDYISRSKSILVGDVNSPPSYLCLSLDFFPFFFFASETELAEDDPLDDPEELDELLGFCFLFLN